MTESQITIGDSLPNRMMTKDGLCISDMKLIIRFDGNRQKENPRQLWKDLGINIRQDEELYENWNADDENNLRLKTDLRLRRVYKKDGYLDALVIAVVRDVIECYQVSEAFGEVLKLLIYQQGDWSQITIKMDAGDYSDDSR